MTRQRSVLISGCSSGIGRATAEHLADAGWRVFAGVRGEESIGRTPNHSELLTPIDLDVGDEGSIARARDLIAGSESQRLDALVNNAGIAVGGALETVPLPDLRRILEVNVIGQVALTQAFLPMLRASEGKLVFVGSLGGRVAFPYAAPYHASKFAIEAIGDSLRAELRDQRVSVSVIEPGTIATPIWSKAIEQVASLRGSLQGEVDELYSKPMGGFEEKLRSAEQNGADPEEVARKIAEALDGDSPKDRYRVGRGVGTLIVLKALIPVGIFDRVLRRVVR